MKSLAEFAGFVHSLPKTLLKFLKIDVPENDGNGEAKATRRSRRRPAITLLY
jgi:hypothetical protein